MSARHEHVRAVDEYHADYDFLEGLNRTVPFDLVYHAAAYAAWKTAEDELRAHDDEVAHD